MNPGPSPPGRPARRRPATLAASFDEGGDTRAPARQDRCRLAGQAKGGAADGPSIGLGREDRYTLSVPEGVRSLRRVSEDDVDIVYRFDPHAPLIAPSTKTAAEALERLAAGNARFRTSEPWSSACGTASFTAARRRRS